MAADRRKKFRRHRARNRVREKWNLLLYFITPPIENGLTVSLEMWDKATWRKPFSSTYRLVAASRAKLFFLDEFLIVGFTLSIIFDILRTKELSAPNSGRLKIGLSCIGTCLARILLSPPDGYLWLIRGFVLSYPVSSHVFFLLFSFKDKIT